MGERVGMSAVVALSLDAKASLTASAIRIAECAEYPVAVIVSHADEVCYCFMSDSFKKLRKSGFLRKGDPLPFTATRDFNEDTTNIRAGRSAVAETDLRNWFGCQERIRLDEEIVGLGSYGLTLTVLSSDALSGDDV